MPAPEPIQTPWVDIIKLPAPTESFNLNSIFLTIIVITVLFFILRHFWQQPRYKALRKLRRIDKQTNNTRHQLFLLRQTLQQGLQVNHLRGLALSPQQQHAWEIFCLKLVHACYQPEVPAREDVLLLTIQARNWIKQL